ncbi:hypothetical protein HBH97_249640, partial [Parastagonospora nodorum]
MKAEEFVVIGETLSMNLENYHPKLPHRTRRVRQLRQYDAPGFSPPPLPPPP